MKNDQFIDAVQTIGIVTIAIVLSYVVVRLEGTLNRSADRLKKVLIHQDEIIRATDCIGRRIETIEAVLTAANDRLQRDCAGLTVERDALTVALDELLARVSDLEQMVAAGEAASSAALDVLAERSANLEQTERDLDDNRRALHALSDQLPAIRTEFVSKESRLREVEQQRAALKRPLRSLDPGERRAADED